MSAKTIMYCGQSGQSDSASADLSVRMHPSLAIRFPASRVDFTLDVARSGADGIDFSEAKALVFFAVEIYGSGFNCDRNIRCMNTINNPANQACGWHC
jgi:hypothetical protein